MKKTLNILMVSKTLPHSFKGGIQTHVWELSKWLINLGHSVTILTSGSIKKGIFSWEVEHRKIIELPYFPGRKIPIVGLALEEFFFNKAVKSWLKTHHSYYDIIHLQGRSGYLYPEWKTKHHATPNVVTVHGIAKIEFQNAKNSSAKMSRKIHAGMAQHFEKKELLFSDGIIAVSTETKNMLQREFSDIKQEIVIINNGIDINDFNKRNDIKVNKNQLLFVGRLDAIKGIIPLIKTMIKLPEAHLVVVGNGEEMPTVKKLIAQYQLSDRITLLGAQPIETVRQKIHESALLILPSFYETQGIVSMEANACFKPVAASNIAGIREVMQDGYNGLLFEPGNIEDMAEKIRWLLNNPNEANAMGESGRKLMEQKFSWETIAQQTVDFYNKILENGKN